MPDQRETFESVLRPHLAALPGGEPLDWDRNLRALGLNSMRAVDLVIDLEDAFGIAFPDEFFHDETFATAGALWSALRTLFDEPAERSGATA
jgi:acyl carrier protein